MEQIKKVFTTLKENSTKVCMLIVKKFMNLSRVKKIAVSSTAFLLIIALLATSILPVMNLFPDSVRSEFNKMYVRVGDSHIIRLTGIYDKRMETIENVSCVSSNKDILDTDGNKIIGMKPGKVKVTVKHWFKKVEMDVEVVPLQSAFQPSEEYLQAEYARFDKKRKEKNDVNLNAVSDGEKVYVTWQEVKGAAKYIIYRSNDNKNFNKIYETEKSGPYMDKKAKNGENFYKIQAVDKKGKELSYKRVGINNDVISGINLKADNDKDGLTNIEELKNCTDMNKKDTDGDGIDDKKAVELFGAGTPVLNPDENSDVKQIEMNEKETKEENGLTKKGFESEDKKVAVEVSGEKEIKDADITLIERTDEFYKSHKGIIGKVNDIDFNGKGLKEARINLSYKDEDLNGAKEDNLKIYFLNEKDGKVEAAKDIKVDKKNKTISGTVTHFSPYAIGDSKIFGDQPIGMLGQPVEMVFVIDASKKIKDAGGINASTTLLNRFSDYFKDLKANNANFKMGIVTFSEVPKVIVPLTDSEQEFTAAIANVNGTQGRSAIADGMMIGKGLFSSENTAKKLILVTDGKDENGIPGSELRKLAEVYGDKITINTVAYGENADNETMKDMAELSGGIYFDMGKGVVDAEVEEIYAKISKQLWINDLVELPSEYVDGLKKNMFPEEYKGTAFPESLELLADSNGNVLTGNYIESVQDIDIKLNTMDLTFERTYNSDNSDKAGFVGNGWSTNYDTSLYILPRYGEAKKDCNIRLAAGKTKPIIFKASAGTVFEYVTTSGGAIATTTADGKTWEKLKYENMIFYVEQNIFKDMGSGVSVTYPSGSVVTFKNGTVNSGGVTEYISPYGVYDKLIYKSGKFYLIFKSKVNVYDESGKLVQICDKDGRVQNITYSSEKISKIEDQAGRKLTFKYDYKGMLYRIVDDLGGYVEYIRDSNDNLTGVLDKEGNKTTYTYYDWKENYRLKEIIDPTNLTVIRNEYDRFGRISVQYYNGSARIHMYEDIYRDDDGNIIEGFDRLKSYYIDERGIESSVNFNPVTLKPTASTDANGKETLYKYYVMFDGESNYSDITNIEEDDANDVKLKTQYDKGNTKTASEVIDRRNNTVRTELDKNGNKTLEKNADGDFVIEYLESNSSNYSSYIQYFRLFAVKKTTGVDLGETEYVYQSGNTKVTKIIDPMENETEFEYYTDSSMAGIFGLVKKVNEHKRDKDGILISNFNTTTFEYDGYGNKTKIIDNQGNETIQTYDVLGRLTSSLDSKQKSSSFKYDKLNRVVEASDKKGNLTKTIFDDKNRKRTIIDREGNEVIHLLNEFGKIKEAIDPEGNKVIYKYDSKGNNVSITDQLGRTTYFVYNEMDKLKASIDANGNITDYEYDAEGNLEKVTDPELYETRYGYDGMNRVMLEERDYTEYLPDGSKSSKTKKIDYIYEEGNLKIVQDSSGISIKYDYDLLGRKISEIYGYGLVDDEGNLIQKETKYEFNCVKQTEELGVEENFTVTSIINPMEKASLSYTDELGRLRKIVTPGGRTTRYQYDEVGNLVKEIKPRNNEISYEYDELGRMTKTIFDDNTFIQKEYYPEGQLMWEKDQKGNITSYNYNSKYKVTDITDPQNRKTFYEYNPTGTVKNIIDTWGNKTDFEYDELNRVIKTIDPMGYETKVEYDWKGNVKRAYSKNDPTKYEEIGYDEFYRPYITKNKEGGYSYIYYNSAGNVMGVTDPLGNTTMYEYDSLGRKTKEILPGDSTISAGSVEYEYNKLDQVVKTKSSLGKIEEFKYKDDGMLEETKSYPIDKPEEAITEVIGYDVNANVISITDAKNNITEFEYNSLDLLEKEIKRAGGKVFETTYKYDPVGNLEKTTDYRGNTTTYKYDELNQNTEIIDAFGKTVSKVNYYPEEKKTETRDALGNKTTSYYNNNMQVVKTVMPNNGENLFTYDREGNIKTQTDALGNTTTFEYSVMNRLTKVTDPLNEEVIITYDLNGNMTSIKDGEGNTTSYEYNSINLPAKRIDPEGKIDGSYVAGKVESYTYREDGSLVSKIDRNGINHSYEYDIYGRLTNKTAGDESVSFEYDELSNLTKMSDGTGDTVRKYDELGRCTEKTVPAIGKSTYEYDIITGLNANEEGAVAEKTVDPKGNETLKVYDKAGRLSRVTADGKDTTYEYYDNGATSKINRGNGSTSSYVYNNMNQLTELTTTKGTGIIEEFSYEYDLNGNMTKRIDRKGTTLYNYDEVDRLKKITEPGNKITEYTYDKAGNRLTQTVDGVTTNYEYNEQNRLTRTDDGTNEYKFYYDNNGNQLKQTKVEASAETVLLENIYNEFNQAVETRAGTSIIKNTYNGDGLRVEKEVNGSLTNYLYEGSQPILETDAGNNESGRSVFGNNLISRTIGNTTYDYAYNGAGEITGLIDTNGNFAAQYYYDAFGVQTERTGQVNNPYSYKGYQYDEESELYYLNARYYNPETARFMTEDTYRGSAADPLSLNLYTYCVNNPITFYDPTGHWPSFIDSIVSFGASVVKNIASAAVSVYTNFVAPVYLKYIVPAAVEVAKKAIEVKKNFEKTVDNIAKTVKTKVKNKIEQGKKFIDNTVKVVKKEIIDPGIKKAKETYETVVKPKIEWVESNVIAPAKQAYENTVDVIQYVIDNPPTTLEDVGAMLTGSATTFVKNNLWDPLMDLSMLVGIGIESGKELLTGKVDINKPFRDRRDAEKFWQRMEGSVLNTFGFQDNEYYYAGATITGTADIVLGVGKVVAGAILAGIGGTVEIGGDALGPFTFGGSAVLNKAISIPLAVIAVPVAGYGILSIKSGYNSSNKNYFEFAARKKTSSSKDNKNKKNKNNNSNNSKMIGENGTQVSSKTTWQNGKTERVDVENPNPGSRPGQVHYHESDNTKWIYDIEEGYFVGEDGVKAPNKIQKKLNNKDIINGINKGLDILGEGRIK